MIRSRTRGSADPAGHSAWSGTSRDCTLSRRDSWKSIPNRNWSTAIRLIVDVTVDFLTMHTSKGINWKFWSYNHIFTFARAIEQLGGLESESDYPYTAHAQSCHFNKTKIHVRVSGAVDLPQDETAMAQWLYSNGPLSIGTYFEHVFSLVCILNCSISISQELTQMACNSTVAAFRIHGRWCARRRRSITVFWLSVTVSQTIRCSTKRCHIGSSKTLGDRDGANKDTIVSSAATTRADCRQWSARLCWNSVNIWRNYLIGNRSEYTHTGCLSTHIMVGHHKLTDIFFEYLNKHLQ